MKQKYNAISLIFFSDAFYSQLHVQLPYSIDSIFPIILLHLVGLVPYDQEKLKLVVDYYYLLQLQDLHYYLCDHHHLLLHHSVVVMKT